MVLSAPDAVRRRLPPEVVTADAFAGRDRAGRLHRANANAHIGGIHCPLAGGDFWQFFDEGAKCCIVTDRIFAGAGNRSADDGPHVTDDDQENVVHGNVAVDSGNRPSHPIRTG